MPDTDLSEYVARPSIGGSDIGALLGVNRYKTAASVYDRIVTILDGGPLAVTNDSNDAERGRELEAACVRKYERETWRQTARGETVTHPEYPFMHANVDRLIVQTTGGDPYQDRGTGILEAKCPRLPNWRMTREMGVDPSYYAQVQHYMAVAGLSWASFAFLNAEDWVLHTIDIDRDEEMIADIYAVCEGFWVAVQDRARTTVQGIEHLMQTQERARATQERARLTAGTAVRDTAEWRTALQNVLRAQNEYRIAEVARESAREILTQMIEREGIEAISVPGVGRVTYKEQTHESIDMEQLVLQHPELDLARYVRRTSYRTLRPTFGRT